MATLPVALAGQVQEDVLERDGGLGIRGVVVDRESGHPIEGVAVTVRRVGDGTEVRPVTVLTDASGRFGFGGLESGRYGIEIERIGYQPILSSVDFRADFGLAVDVELVQEAVELEPLIVAAEARSRNLDANGFYDRQSGGIGRFLTREEIQARNELRVSSVLRTIGGVRMSSGGPRGQGLILLRHGCVPDVYLDGVRTMQPFPVDDLLQTNDVDGVEVYQASEVPARFGNTNCGAVVIWTHVPNRGARGSPFTLGRALTVIGFTALALFFTR
jgi:hypothetical protein